MNDSVRAANSGSRADAPSHAALSRPIGFDPGREFATFSQSRNDMHWSLWAGEDKFIRWTGYDDHYWWSNVAATDQFRVRRGAVTARIYRLDPATGAVEITEATNGNG